MENLQKAKKIMDIYVRYHDGFICDDDIKKYVSATFVARELLGTPLDEGFCQEIFDYAKRYARFLQTRHPAVIGVGLLNPESPF